MKVTAATGIVVSLVVLAAVVGALMFWPRAEPQRPAPKVTAVAPAPPAVKDAVEALKSLTDEVAPQPDRTTGAPAFDVARIEPNGDAVIGGRAAPGATVELLRGGVSHAQTVVGPSGDFVLVPKRLPPGNYDLTLRATQKDGKVSMSKDSVAVALRSESVEKPVVALVAPDKPAVVLSKPETGPTIALAIDAVEGEAGGKLYVSGRAPPGARVRLYLNDAYIASATASAEKRVAFSIQSGIKPGDYRVRLDQVDASGKVQNRAEVPFNAPVAVAEAPAPKPAGQLQTSEASTPKLEAHPQTSRTPAPRPDSPARVAAAPAGSGADTSTAATPQPAAAQKSQPTPPKPEPRETAAAPAAPSRQQSAPPQTQPQSSSYNTEIASAPAPKPAAQQAAPAPQTTPAPAPRNNASSATGTPPPPSLASSEPAASPPPAPKDAPAAGVPGDRKDVVVVPSVDTTLVVRGDSLWRISRSTYGHGIRYSVIYNANRDQIRDPDLIYPGQIFVLPKEQREE